jgi:hypothetical protein
MGEAHAAECDDHGGGCNFDKGSLHDDVFRLSDCSTSIYHYYEAKQAALTMVQNLGTAPLCRVRRSSAVG